MYEGLKFLENRNANCAVDAIDVNHNVMESFVSVRYSVNDQFDLYRERTERWKDRSTQREKAVPLRNRPIQKILRHTAVLLLHIEYPEFV